MAPALSSHGEAGRWGCDPCRGDGILTFIPREIVFSQEMAPAGLWAGKVPLALLGGSRVDSRDHGRPFSGPGGRPGCPEKAWWQ